MPALLLTLGDEQFSLRGVTVQEMSKVKGWTTYKNRAEWFAAITDEDPDALIAAYKVAKMRKDGKAIPRHEDVEFSLDDLDAKFVDEGGREVELSFEKNKDGTYKTDKNGLPVPVLDKDGAMQWVYADSGEPVPPTETASPTS